MQKKTRMGGITLPKMVGVFLIGSFVGCIYETILQFCQTGDWVLFKGLLYGPFNQVYGFGALFFMLTLSFLQSPLAIFLLGAIVGGVFEFIASYLQEIIFHVVSWNYSTHFLNFQGRTSVPVMIGWGLIAVVFIKWILPFLERYIEKIPHSWSNLVTWLILLFFLCDFGITFLAFNRDKERYDGVSPQQGIDYFLDKYYPSSYLEERFPYKKKS